MTHAEFFEASDIIALEHTTTAAPEAMVRRTIAEVYPGLSAEDTDIVLDCWYHGLVADEDAADADALPDESEDEYDEYDEYLVEMAILRTNPEYLGTGGWKPTFEQWLKGNY